MWYYPRKGLFWGDEIVVSPPPSIVEALCLVQPSCLAGFSKLTFVWVAQGIHRNLNNILFVTLPNVSFFLHRQCPPPYFFNSLQPELLSTCGRTRPNNSSGLRRDEVKRHSARRGRGRMKYGLCGGRRACNLQSGVTLSRCHSLTSSTLP